MHSFVGLFLSALLIFSASAANLYQQDESEFAAAEEDESQFDDMESEVDDQQTQAMTQMEAFLNVIPKVQEPSGSQDLSKVQATITESISLPRFFVGRSVEVRYITPSTGRPTMDLYDAHGNILLHVNPRWDTRAFVLNTFHNKRWGREERPSGFDFTSGVPITVRVEALHSHLAILVNGRILHYYKHRLNISTLRHIIFHWGGSSFKPAKLISLSVYY
ncbi:PREDICTED: 32 kDa beta-galactoside-binding lectin-like [Amphimedon queenslandica]|uniref:Galectin n=1 Tax=Amphimedon queenslandica TaxID=400682 RepID=A0A1X7UMC5_AMPQE|nr:PREDICTED: 32 kDa beta-galactoside-binding lectin-like [Amphimedon queenslandica]|eukprot:XP_011404707.1 PREDICTED: 32 kDa beta-galactoside-binding lectin-like [Amphimedon queenslandica]